MTESITHHLRNVRNGEIIDATQAEYNGTHPQHNEDSFDYASIKAVSLA